jgi:hypothetical protein
MGHRSNNQDPSGVRCEVWAYTRVATFATVDARVRHDAYGREPPVSATLFLLISATATSWDLLVRVAELRQAMTK